MSAAVSPTNSPAVVYKNPIPVVVGLVPVRAFNPETQRQAIGLLVLERGIEPKKGMFALPGGYLEYEDWREGLLREIQEETALRPAGANEIELTSLSSVEQGKKLLIFAMTPVVDEGQLASFVPSAEASQLKVIFKPETMAFPTHTAAVSNFFARLDTVVEKQFLNLKFPEVS